MYEIIFWGGPKDGLVEYQSTKPGTEVYYTDPESQCVEVDEFLSIKDNPRRELVYHKYILTKETKSRFKYIFSGAL